MKTNRFKFKYFASGLLAILILVLSYQIIVPIWQVVEEVDPFNNFPEMDEDFFPPEAQDFFKAIATAGDNNPKGSKLLSSDNFGKSWVELAIKQEGQNIIDSLRISALQLGKKGQLFVGTIGQGILRCQSKDKDWEVMDWYLPNSRLTITDFARDYRNNIHCIGNFDGILVLDANRNEWRRVSSGSDLDLKAIEYGKKRFASAVFESVSSSFDGLPERNTAVYQYKVSSGRWKPLTRDIESSVFNKLTGFHISSDNHLYYGANSSFRSELYYSKNKGKEWELLLDCDEGNIQTISTDNKKNVIIGTDQGYLLRSNLDWPVDSVYYFEDDPESGGYLRTRMDTLLRLADTISINTVVRDKNGTLIVAGNGRNARTFNYSGSLDEILPSIAKAPEKIPVGRIILFFVFNALMPLVVFIATRYFGLKLLVSQMYHKDSSFEAAEEPKLSFANPTTIPKIKRLQSIPPDDSQSQKVSQILDRPVNQLLIDLIFGFSIILLANSLKATSIFSFYGMMELDRITYTTLSVFFLIITSLIWISLRKNSLILQGIFVVTLVITSFYFFRNIRSYYLIIGLLSLYIAWLIRQVRIKQKLVEQSPNQNLLILRVFGFFKQQKNILGQITKVWRYFGSYFTIADPGLIQHEYRLFGPKMLWHGLFLYILFLLGGVILSNSLDLFYNPGAELSKLLRGRALGSLGTPAGEAFVNTGSFWDILGLIFSVNNLFLFVLLPGIIAMLVALAPLYAFVKYQFLTSANMVKDEQVTFASKKKNSLSYKGRIVYCFDNIWKLALWKMVNKANIIVMDFRGYTTTKRGIIYELRYLINHFPIDRVVFILSAEETGESINLFQKVVTDNWKKMAATSPNLNNQQPIFKVFLADQRTYDPTIIVTNLMNDNKVKTLNEE